jgi:uncharacterized protein YbbK (DUF523 family)
MKRVPLCPAVSDGVTITRPPRQLLHDECLQQRSQVSWQRQRRRVGLALQVRRQSGVEQIDLIRSRKPSMFA